eukprot:48929_1
MKMISLFCIIVIIAINAESSRLLLVDNCATTGCGICFQCNPNSGKCTEKYDCCLNHYGCNGNKICINRRCNDNCATTGCGICFQCNPNSGKCTEQYNCCLNHYGCNGNKICINRQCSDPPNPGVVKCGGFKTCYNGEIHVQIIQLINQHQNVMVMDKHV